MHRLASFFLCALAAAAVDDTPEKPAALTDRMRAAAERQRAAARRQTGGSEGGFFTTSWTTPLTPLNPRASVVHADCDPLPEAQLSSLVADAAQKEGVNPSLVRAIIRRESGERPCAVSEKGAQGLMQLMPATQADLGVDSPLDPAQNVGGGTRYIRDLLARYKGDVRLALAAYNAGPQRVDSTGGVPDIPETRAFVDAVSADVAP